MKDAFRRMVAAMILATAAHMAAAESDNQVVLAANNVSITEQELIDFIRFKSGGVDVESALGKPNALNRLVEDIYVVKRLAQQGIDADVVDEEEVTWLAEDHANRRVLAAYLKQKVDEALADADWELVARERYVADPELYSSGEKVDVAHILISAEGRSFNEIADRVSTIEERLAAGESFEAVALEMSDDPSVTQNQGSLGAIGKGDTHPIFEKAAFALTEIGDVSEPVLTPFGVHVITLKGRVEPSRPRFEQVKHLLIKEVKKKRRSELQQSMIDTTRLELVDATLDLDLSRIRARIEATGIVE